MSTVTGVVVDGHPAHAARRGPFPGWTLRRTLVTSIVSLFAVVMVLIGVGISTLVQDALEKELDQRVMTVATRAAGPDRMRGGMRPPRGDGGLLADMLVVEVDGGTVTQNTVATRAGGVTRLSTRQVSALLAADLTPSPSTLDLGDALGAYRLVGVTTPNGERVVTGLPVQPLRDAVTRMRMVMAVLGLIGFGLVGAGTAWLVDRALRPLQRVAATAGRVAHLPLSSGEVTLAERVPLRDTDPRTEVGQVGSALNDLLDHIDTSLRHRQESESQLRRFVADASHELRTPLATVRGYTELSLREPDLPGEVRRSLGRVDAESARMAALVEDLLLLARLDAGRPLERTPVDLTMLLVETVSDARIAGPDHRWQLDLPDEPIEVTGDRARLTQVVVNLLGNARVHTPAGTSVTARLRRHTGAVEIQIEDDGPGIPPELLPTVFARFTRGDDARVRSGASTGLGLSIAQAVVHAHDGDIDVRSSDAGTTFTVHLPA